MSQTYSDLPQLEDTLNNDSQYNDLIEDETSIIDPFNFTDSTEHSYQMQMQSQTPVELQGSSLKGAFFNMTNSIVGAGIVGIPRAFMNSGLFMGIVFMAILTFLNDWTLRLIIVNTKLSGTKSYTGFVSHTYGTFGKIIVLLAQGLFALGGSVGFAIIIGDSIPHVLRSIFADAITNSNILNFLLSRNTIILFCICFICFPLCLIADISKLAKASGLALVSMLVIISIVVIRGPMVDNSFKGSIDGWDYIINGGIFQGISVISFALVCHHNTTFIYDSLRVPTMDRFDMVTHISCAISGFVCGLMGICGFLTFGDKTKGNILNNFPSDDWIVNIARLCFGLNMITTLPLEVYVFREILKDLFIIYNRLKNPSFDMVKFNRVQNLIVTSFIIAIPLITAMLTCNLGAVLELVGATSGSTLAYILPPLCHNKMTKEHKSVVQQAPYYICAVFGFIVMILSSSQTILETFKNNSDAGHCVS